MRVIFILTLLISIVSVALGANCTSASHNDCDACTSIPGCGWCAPVQQCLEGNLGGPNGSTCVGSSWSFGNDSCPACQLFTSCDTCLEHSTDCIFCPSLNGGLGGCRDIGYVGCQGGIARTCPCGGYSACSDCVGNTNCQYCQNEAVCVAINNKNATCTGSVFNTSSQCPCVFQENCQSCQASGCEWCGVCSNPGTCASPAYGSCDAWCNQASVTCENCVEEAGCSWCGSQKKCVDALSTPCDITDSCPMCQAASYCDPCLSMDGCIWCDDTKKCESSVNSSCFASHTCTDYCGLAVGCEDCNKQRGCMWCEDTKQCGDLSITNNCAFQSNCKAPVVPVPSPVPAGRHFDGPSFVGGMFLVIGGAILCVCAYFFYRWKTGKRIEYRPL